MSIWGRIATFCVLVPALAGCGFVGGDGDDEATGPAPDSSSEVAAPRVTSTPIPAASLPPLVPGRQIGTPDEVLVTVTPVTLRRQGRLAVLEVSVRNDDPDDSVNVANPLRGSGTRFDEVTLVDPANAKRYVVARDSEDQCLCTSFMGGMSVEPGQTGVVSAYFAAPPESVKAVNVEVPGVGSFPNVPLS